MAHKYRDDRHKKQSFSPAFMPVCLNCSIYSWEQVKIPSPVGPFYMKELSTDPLLRCSQCKMAHYCDKDCQLEHWEKVHKERCKYSRGDKPQKAGVHAHRVNGCEACKEEGEVGAALGSKNDTHWGCHLKSRKEFWANPTHTFRGRDGKLYDGPLGIELGELTLNFTSRAEHVVSFLQRILYKMKLTKHDISAKNEFEELDQELFFLRHDFLMKAAIIPAGKLVYHSHSMLLHSGKQSYILDIIRALGNSYSDNTKHTFRLWDTFILIFDYFLDNIKDCVKDFEDLGWKVKDKKMRGVMEQVERAAEVQEKWEQVVVALSQGVAPYYTVLEIILGSLQQECSICKLKIKIESTFGDHPSGSIKERRPVGICQGTIFNFHCGSKKCREQVVERHTMDQVAITMTTTEYIQDHKKDRCDWCSTMKRNVHRCRRCLTKVYCSKECHDMDWKIVHKKVCRKEPDVRKLKMKKNDRVFGKEELPDTITLKDGTTMPKRSAPAVITCPVSPCPDPRKDLVGFYRHELLLYVPWGAHGQPDFKNMPDSAIVEFYTKKKKDIEVVRKKHSGSNGSASSESGGIRHINEKGEEIIYDGFSIMKIVD